MISLKVLEKAFSRRYTEMMEQYGKGGENILFVMKAIDRFQSHDQFSSHVGVPCWCIKCKPSVRNVCLEAKLIPFVPVVNQQAATPTFPLHSTEARVDAAAAINSNADQLTSIPRRLQNPSKS